MKRVLIISTFFPPSTKVAGVRPAKFAKFLPEFGWQPVVLTTSPKDAPSQRNDPAGFPLVFATPAPSLDGLYALGRKIAPREAIMPSKQSEILVKEKEFSGRAEIINSWLFVPDRSMGWFLFALRKGLQIAKAQSIQAIFSTSPDPTGHLVAKWLAKRLAVPWIADFQDPWAYNPFLFYPSNFHLKLARRLEKGVVNAASHVLTVSDVWRDEFSARYPNQPSKKFGMISNGYDSADFANLSLPQSSKDDNTITIVHNGAFFYYGKDPFPFLQGVRLLLQQQTVRLKIKFVGTHPKKILPTLQEWGLTDVVECIPFLPRIESLPYLLAADILLLITGPIHGVLTAKVFEYLYTNRPILSLNAERGILTDYLEEANTGRIVTSTSPQEIADALLSLIQDVKEQRLPDPNRSFIARFEYKHLTSQLAQVLDQLGA